MENKEIYCLDCGLTDVTPTRKFNYERTSASGDHYTCGDCGSKDVYTRPLDKQ